MRNIVCIHLVLSLFFIPTLPAEAIKKYWYNENGERVYRTITLEEIHQRKSAPRRSFIRVPRTNWEMTPAMRARKKTTSQLTHRNYESKRAVHK